MQRLADSHGGGDPSLVAGRLEASLEAVRSRVSASPRLGLVLGSGLGDFADDLTHLVKIAYADVGLPEPRVAGHAGNLCFGEVGDVPVVCMQGRVHLYEGHRPDQVVHGARLMARLGVDAVLLTNAAGGVDESFCAGDLMVVVDHLNLTTTSPLIGPNDPRIGPRFPDMSAAYDPALRAAAKASAEAIGLSLREGVYAGLTGPAYETPAEVRMLRGLGAHAVGMSTVHEVIALRHMGVRVGALSCITNLAAGLSKGPLDHGEVEAMARARRATLGALLREWIARAAHGPRVTPKGPGAP